MAYSCRGLLFLFNPKSCESIPVKEVCHPIYALLRLNKPVKYPFTNNNDYNFTRRSGLQDLRIRID